MESKLAAFKGKEIRRKLIVERLKWARQETGAASSAPTGTNDL
ncbi:MAG: hypothetical protein Q7T53_10955 [Deltaproteobacteria bacterium]|nr:hypothetical protein [Deltaproteobacteria bacterium]